MKIGQMARRKLAPLLAAQVIADQFLDAHAFRGHQVGQIEGCGVGKSLAMRGELAGTIGRHGTQVIGNVQAGLALEPGFDLQVAQLLLCLPGRFEKETPALAVDAQPANGVAVSRMPGDGGDSQTHALNSHGFRLARKKMATFRQQQFSRNQANRPENKTPSG